MEQLAQQSDETVETTRDQLGGPAVWIGNAEDYADGERFGGWVDLSGQAIEVMRRVRAVIDRAPPELGKQWRVCATHGMGGWTPDQHESLPAAMRVATGVQAFGEHYGGLASVLGTNSPALTYERYKHSYLGSWQSRRAFIEQLVVESGWREALSGLARQMQPYVFINYRAMIRDAERELTFVGHPDGVWVYDPRVW